MKRIFSFVLAALMLVSVVPTTLATNDYTQGTQVVYTANGSESYTITVPAQLAPGGSGTVTLSGTWADNRIVTVTAEPTVTLTNSIKAEDQKVLNVHFDGISEAGSNTGSQTFTEDVSVDDITNVLFGTWSGKFNYNVALSNAVTPKNGLGDYTWEELKAIANSDAPLAQYNISIGDSFWNGYRYYLVSDERNEDYGGLVFMYSTGFDGTMNPVKTNEGGYLSAPLKQTVDGVYDDMPQELQDAIKTVTIKSNDGGLNYAETHTADVKIFIPSAREVSGTYSDGDYTQYLDAEGNTFDWFTNAETELSNRRTISTNFWWLRSARSTHTNNYWRCYDGEITSGGCVNSYRVVVAFVVG